MPTQSKGGYGPIADMLLPIISATKARTGDKTVNIGPGGLLGLQDVGQNYTDYINQRERERLMTPMAKKMHYLQAGLARQIGLEMGMPPEKATLSATRVSPPSVMAWGLMKANKVDDILMKFEKAMQSEGIISPFGLKGSRLSTEAYNNRTQTVLSDILTMVIDPRISDKWGNMSSDKIADVILPRYLSGEYNDILQSPTNFDNKGNLTNTARNQLFGKMSGTTQAINELQYIFPGTDPNEAYDKMSHYFGEDPIKALGAGPVKKLFRNLRATARSTGVSQDDMVNLMANIGSEYKKSGRDPFHALSSAKDLMLLAAASREGPSDADPGRYNQAMISNVTAARHSPIADTMGQAYSALSDKVGDVEARKILAKVSTDRSNFENPQNFIKAINLNLGNRTYPLDEGLLATYADNPKTRFFKASGMGTITMLQHYAGQMQDYRKKLLQRKFGWNGDQLIYLDKLGGPTVANIKKYVSGMGLPNSNEVRKKIFAIQSAFDNLAKNQGFEKATAADRFISGVTNDSALKRYKQAERRAERVANSLEKQPRPGGVRGLTQYIAGNKTQGNWWEAITGSKTLSPGQIAELQGVDINKFDEPSKQIWGKAISGWLAPEKISAKERENAVKTLGNMEEMNYGR